MANLPKKTERPAIVVSDDEKQFRLKMEEFMKALLNKQPPKERIKQNKFANNADYLSVGWIEMQLDKIYMGRWNTKIETKWFADAVVCDLSLEVIHPLTNELITRAGTGAMQIQKDGNAYKAKAFEKAVPAAKAAALKNAAKSLGKFFGRDLNRDTVMDAYDYMYTKSLN